VFVDKAVIIVIMCYFLILESVGASSFVGGEMELFSSNLLFLLHFKSCYAL